MSQGHKIQNSIIIEFWIKKHHSIFHVLTVYLDIIKVLFIHQLMHQWFVFKKILKFTLIYILCKF